MAQNWTVKVSHIESEALSTLKLYWLFYQMMHFYALLILPLSKMFADFSSRRFSPKFNCHPHTGWLNASPDKITIVFLNEIPSHQPSIYVYIYTIIDYNDTIMYKKYIQYIYIYTHVPIYSHWLAGYFIISSIVTILQLLGTWGANGYKVRTPQHRDNPTVSSVAPSRLVRHRRVAPRPDMPAEIGTPAVARTNVRKTKKHGILRWQKLGF